MLRFKRKHLRSVTSTNDLAIEMGREGSAEGWVVSADFQTQGRGRYQRPWMAARGKNLLFSILLRPPISPAKAPILTHLAARSVLETLTQRFPSMPCRMKKPNDILVNEKKICGILVESFTQRRSLDFVVVGVGLNVHAAPRGLPQKATSISREAGRRVQRFRLLDQILDNFKKHYATVF